MSKSLNNKKECIICKKVFIAKANSKTCSSECSKDHRKFLRSTEYKNLHTDFAHKKEHDKESYFKNREKIRKQVMDRYYKLKSENKLADKWAKQALYKRDNLKLKAKASVKRALKDGRIIKSNCVVCGEKAEGHHPDYAKPYDVIWLCKKHHEAVHRKYDVLILDKKIYG